MPVNREVFEKTIAVLKSEVEMEKLGIAGFDMMFWAEEADDDCGTVCCIGGTMQAVMGLSNSHLWTDVGEKAGLSESPARCLFFPMSASESSRLAYSESEDTPRLFQHSMETTKKEAITLLEGILDESVVFDFRLGAWVYAEKESTT